MAIETEGGTYINVNGNEEKGHVNIYDSDPRGEHNSIHININYDEETFTITEKEDDKKTSEKHKCFLTTACMKHQLKYFDDNCYELTTLRWFRDKFVTKSDIQYYYQIAPIIVNVLNNVSNSDEMYPMQNGKVGLGIHGIRKEPQLERPYFGHIFTEEDKKNLRESGNMGRVAELNLRGGTTEPCLISIDKNTNELVAVRQEHVYVQDEVRGVKLSPDEIQTLKNGGQVFVDGMISNKGKEFSATLQYSAERRGLEFIFPKDQAFNQQSLGGVQLSPTQLKMLSEGHTILVEDMKRRNSDEVFSSFVTLDKVTGRPNYTRHNPETGEIYIPKEICNVQLTHEDKELLRKGQPVFLENMVNRKGEEFSAFVKLNMTTGNPQYSRTPDGFNEQQAPRIPAEVYGHVFTAQERANLQDGKAILISDLKSNGKQFSSYLKVNPGSGQLQYFQDNPDIRRDTSRRATQADNAQQQEQKKSAKQAM